MVTLDVVWWWSRVIFLTAHAGLSGSSQAASSNGWSRGSGHGGIGKLVTIWNLSVYGMLGSNWMWAAGASWIGSPMFMAGPIMMRIIIHVISIVFSCISSCSPVCS